MADNIIFFDKYHTIKKKLPGFGTAKFENSYAEMRVFVHAAEGNFLTPAELAYVASKLLSPSGLCILRQFLKHLQCRQR